MLRKGNHTRLDRAEKPVAYLEKTHYNLGHVRSTEFRSLADLSQIASYIDSDALRARDSDCYC